MIVIQADLNHLDPHGRLRLSDLAMHRDTPFHEIMTRGDQILFVDGQDIVHGQLSEGQAVDWLGDVDWSTQQMIGSWPPATVLTP